MPPQGPGPQQSNGNAPQQQTGQGAPQITQNQQDSIDPFLSQHFQRVWS